MFEADQKKPKLLMLAGVAGGLCVVGGGGQCILDGRRKLNGQFSTINASSHLILQ